MPPLDLALARDHQDATERQLEAAGNNVNGLF